MSNFTPGQAVVDFRWPFQRVAERASQWSAVLLPIALVLPTAWLSIFEVLLLVTWLASGRYSLKYARIRENLIALLALGLFGLLLLGTLYSQATWSESFDTLDNYIALLFVPIIVSIFDEEMWRDRAQRSVLIGIAVIVVVVCLRWLGLLPESYDVRMAFKNHITEGVMLSFGCFLIAHRMAVSSRRWFFWLLSLILVSSLLFFLYASKSGYVVFAALFLLFFWQRFGWRAVVPSLALLVAAMVALWSASETFQERINTGWKGLVEYQPGKASASVGVRLEYYKNTLLLIEKNPLTGVGTGGFPSGYRDAVAGMNLPKRLITDNPHNEYLLLAAQLGIGGAILFLVLLSAQWLKSFKLPPASRHTAQGVVIAMGVGCLFNSMLMDFTDGAWFGLLSGIVFSGLNSR